MGRSLVMKVKYSDFRQTTHSYTGSTPITDIDEILGLAADLLADVDMADRSVRLLGLSVTSPVIPDTPHAGMQLTIDW